MVAVALLLDFQSVSMWPPEVIMGNTSPVSSVPISSNDKIAIQVNQSPVHEVKNAEDEGLAKTHSPDRPDDPGRALAVCQQMNSPSSSEKIQSSACSMESTKSKIPSLTLQQYRKEVGLKVQNKKRCQKLGISPKTGAVHEQDTEPKTNSGVPCPHCGFPNDPANDKCYRCMRIFEKAKIEPLSAHQSSSENSIHQSSGEISTPPAVPQAKDTYGTRRPRVTEHHTTRQTRQKPEEPQCVTLSSDEEEETPEIKKFKNEPTANEADTSNISQDSSAMHSIEPMSSESETSNKYITTTENQPDCADLEKWSTAGWGGPYFLVNCRSARIGSYRFIPRGRVLFCSKGIRFEVPVVDESGRPSGSETVHITIETFQLLQLEVHFSRSMPVIFLYVTPSLSRSISLLLGLTKDGPGPYFDALSTKEFEKRLTLLPSDLDDAAKNAIRQAFVPKGVFREIDSNEAHRLLVLSSPPEVIEGMKSHDQSPTNTPAHPKSPTVTPSPKVSGDEAKRITRSKNKTSAHPCIPVQWLFQWSEGLDKFSISTDDYLCLNQDNLLNDSIIDFYLRFIFTQLEEELKKKCYVFSSFFYQRLTTRPIKQTGRKHPVEDDPKLSIAEKRHLRVKSWTKKVDIFEKDFIIIPINERSHWFLAIVCFPGLAGPVSKDNKPIVLPALPALPASKTPNKARKKILKVGGESFCIGNTTITPVGGASKDTALSVTVNSDTERDEADSEDDSRETTLETPRSHEEIPEGVKRPCILFFDSLIGDSHGRVAATLREYLMMEYRAKKGGSMPDKDLVSESEKNQETKAAALFSKQNMVFTCLDVPQQTNSYDCGVFILQYAESFMKRPFTDYYLPRLDLKKWFPSHAVRQKRKEIQGLLISLTKQLNPSAAAVLKLLKVDVETKEKSEVNGSDGSSVALETPG